VGYGEACGDSAFTVLGFVEMAEGGLALVAGG